MNLTKRIVQLEREAFVAIAREAKACQLCPALHERVAVLGELNGSATARVMFIAEPPGRQGGDRTGVPLSGDQSGRNFNRFIDSIKLTRDSIFITNAVLCNPRRESGANRTPTSGEVAACSQFLHRQIRWLDPPVVVTLGAVALAALRLVAYHPFALRTAAGQVCEWNARLLVPLYHPSPQVLASHRREAEQLQDYKAVADALRRSIRALDAQAFTFSPKHSW